MLEPAQRRQRIADYTVIATYAERGFCASISSGSDSFPVVGNGVIQVKASIDGVVGTFFIDTGASFVSMTEAFATKAHLKFDAAPITSALTANGYANVKLSKSSSIRLGRLQANDVPIFIVAKPLGPLDGLLGRSFLSRFDMSITRDRLILHSKDKSAAAQK